MKNFYAIFLTILIVDGIVGVLPPTIPRCRRNNPNMSECIVKAITAITPKFATGDLGGGFRVPSLEPFYIKQLIIGEDQGLKIYLSDLSIRGGSKFIIDKFRANINDLKFDVLITLPILDVQAKYKLSFNLLGTIAKSEGNVQTQLLDSKARIAMKAHRLIKNGIEFIKFEPISLKLERGVISSLKMPNLFGGNRVLREIVETTIISDRENFTKIIYPQLQEELSVIFTSIANSIVERASYDELFPLH